MYVSYKNLVLDQDDNFYLIGLSFLINNLLDNVWILEGKVACLSPLRVKRVKPLKIKIHT